MYKFEEKIKEASESGFKFSDGQMTYIRCARINGIDLLDHLYNCYTEHYANDPESSDAAKYLSVINAVLAIIDYFDENLCGLVDQMVRQSNQ